MQISEHFTLEELTQSDAAARRGIDNTPSAEVLENLKRLAEVMERVRVLLLRQPIFVHSGYRSPEVNALVGGVSTSAHCRGEACDFTCAGYGSNFSVALAIASSDIAFDQLILEYGWVHIGLRGSNPRRQLLTKRSASTPYESGINR